MIKLSCVTSVFVNYRLADAIPLIAQAGYQGVDLWGGRPHIYRGDYGAGELRDLRRLLADCGLAAASLMPAFHRYPHSLTSPNERVRQDSLDYVRQCIDSAVLVGAGIVLVVPTRSLYGQSRADARARFTASVGQLAEYAGKQGVTLGIEVLNSSGTDVINTTDAALEVIEELGQPNVGIILDTGHLNLTGEAPAQAVAKAAGRLLEFHVNDNDGRRQQNSVPGEGTFDFTGFAALLRTAGYSGFLPLELGWDYTPDPVPAVTQAAAYLRDLFDLDH